MLAEAKASRSPAMYPALMLALHAGMRDAEIRGLQWERVDLQDAVLTVGDSKTEAGEGRTIPLNSEPARSHRGAREVVHEESSGSRSQTGTCSPSAEPYPSDPTRPMVTLKTAWKNVRTNAKVTGRWHDNRHTFITDLAESGDVSDETIENMAGHVSKQMLKHYSHIRMKAKRAGRGDRWRARRRRSRKAS